MFKEDDIVITILNVPAVIIEVFNSGMEYLVEECPPMPIDSLESIIQGVKLGTIEESLTGVEKRYKVEELRPPTEEEKNSGLIISMLHQGCTLPVIH